MKLLNFSYNNIYYLFINQETGALGVYEIREVKSSRSKSEQKTEYPPEYVFTLRYTLDTLKSHMFAYLHGRGIDVLQYFVENPGQIKVDGKARVKMSYVETVQAYYAESVPADEHKIRCRVVGAIFEQDGDTTTSKCEGFNQRFDFPFDTHTKLKAILRSQEKRIKRKLEHILTIQTRLPKALHDYQEYDNLIQELRKLEDKGQEDDKIFSKLYDDDLIILYSGNYLKYGRLEKLKKPIEDKNCNEINYSFKRLGKKEQGWYQNIFADDEINYFENDDFKETGPTAAEL